jgi:peptide/nickel transport system permease protein
MIPTMFVVSIVTFIIIQLPSGDFMTTLQAEIAESGGGQDSYTIESLRHQYGLDQPPYIQYFKWIAGFPRGDFGYSLEWKAPVWDLIRDRLLFTVLVSGLALALMWIVAIPIGVYSATHQYSPGDNFLTFLSFVGLSVPDFMVALVWLYVGTLVLGMSATGLLTPEMERAPWSLAKVLDLLNHLWAPVIILALAGTAELTRIMRGNLLDVLGQQFVTTARAKGLKERIVINKYAVRVAINPLISIIGMQIPKMINSSTIIGVVLSIPTTGPMFLRALITQDMYLAGAFLLFMTLLLLIGNLLADITLAWVDPRIVYK